jgi:hypothetical protein
MTHEQGRRDRNAGLSSYANTDRAYVSMVCMCECVCASMCVSVCRCVCWCVQVYVDVCVCATWSSNKDRAGQWGRLLIKVPAVALCVRGRGKEAVVRCLLGSGGS